MIQLLAILLGIVFILAYLMSNRELAAPAVIFSFSFFICSIIASVGSNKLQLGLHGVTFLVILLGVVEFVIISFLLKKTRIILYAKPKENIITENIFQSLFIERWKLTLFIVYAIVVTLLSFRYIMSVSSGAGLARILFNYRIMSTTASTMAEAAFPSYLNFMRLILDAGSYFFLYIVADNLVLGKHLNIRALICVFLSFACDLLSGGRGTVVNKLFAFFVVFIILYSYFIKKITLNIKTIIIFFVIVIAGLYGFEYLGILLGRNNLSSGFNYVLVYCGAEIKNLDILLHENSYPAHSEIWGSQTFVNLILWIGGKLNPSKYIYRLNNPFHVVNGFGIGNVSTTFYAFIYDFGYWGELWLVGLMAAITQLVYNQSRYFFASQTKANVPNLALIIYGYMSAPLVLSFFSNKFYEGIFSGTFVKTLLVLVLLSWFFFKVKLVTRKS